MSRKCGGGGHVDVCISVRKGSSLWDGGLI